MKKWQFFSGLAPKPPDWKIDWTEIENSALAPWIEKMKTVQQSPVWHGEGNVWTHTMMVCVELAKMQEWRGLDREKQVELFLAALLHDIGKIPCTRMEDGAWVSPRHSVVGSRMAREILWLKFGLCGESDLLRFRETVCTLIRYHSVPVHILEREKPERCAAKMASMGRLAGDFSLKMLWMLSLADMRGRICADQEEALETVELFRVLAEESNCLNMSLAFPNSYSEYAFLSGKNILPGQKLFDDSWDEVILMSGLPGTGKDTWIRTHAEGYAEISLDKIRKQLNISPGKTQGEVINIAREQAKVYLRKQIPFVWNATNLTPTIREKQVRLFTDYHASVRVVYLETGWEEQMKRNAGREDVVPETVIYDMLRGMSLPERFEACKVQWLCV